MDTWKWIIVMLILAPVAFVLWVIDLKRDRDRWRDAAELLAEYCVDCPPGIDKVCGDDEDCRACWLHAAAKTVGGEE